MMLLFKQWSKCILFYKTNKNNAHVKFEIIIKK